MKEPLRMLGTIPIEEESLKTPRLTIIGVILCATDENGVKQAALLGLQTEPPFHYSLARQRLTERGYRTDWAEWRDDGAFIRLLEDVEHERTAKTVRP